MSAEDLAKRQKLLDALPEWSDGARRKEWDRWYSNLTLDGARAVYKEWFTDQTDSATISKHEVCDSLCYNKYTWQQEKDDVAKILHEAGLVAPTGTRQAKRSLDELYAASPRKKRVSSRTPPALLPPGGDLSNPLTINPNANSNIVDESKVSPKSSIVDSGSPKIESDIADDEDGDNVMPATNAEAMREMLAEVQLLRQEVRVLRERKDRTIPDAFKQCYEMKLTKRKPLLQKERASLLKNYIKYKDLPQAVVEDPSRALTRFKTKDMVPIVKETLPMCQRMAIDVFRVALQTRIDLTNSPMFATCDYDILDYFDQAMSSVAELALDNATQHYRVQRKLIASQLGHPEIAQQDEAVEGKELLFSQADVTLMRANNNFRRDVQRAIAPSNNRGRGGGSGFRGRGRRNFGGYSRRGGFRQPWNSNRGSSNDWRSNSTYNSNSNSNYNNSNNYSSRSRGGRGRGGRN